MSMFDHKGQRNLKKNKHHSGSNSSNDVRPDSRIDEQPVSLISVLNCLSALDSKLGMQKKQVFGLLKKQVFTLLTESVRIEVFEPNSADKLLLIDSNSTMLVTFAQMLIGLVEANILDPIKETAVNRAIEDIATLLAVRCFKTESLRPLRRCFQQETKGVGAEDK